MRVLLVGASGALGTRLVPQLIDAGHEVIGTHNRPATAPRLRSLGALPITLDLLDRDAVRAAVGEHEPAAIVHEATALGDVKFGRNLDRIFATTNRLRIEGTDALLAAAREFGVERFVAQSFAPYRYAREGGMVKSEDDPLDPEPPRHTGEVAAAMRHLDRAVTEAGGVALRYGAFYGADNDGWAELVRKRMYPVVGDGGGLMSFVHLDDAAAATVLALEDERSGVYNIVDDEPAPVREWLPVLAQALGAKPPRHLPAWLARLLAGESAVVNSTAARGASNAKAKRVLGWSLRHPSWRQGFAAVYGAPGSIPSGGTLEQWRKNPDTAPPRTSS
ncbi:MAG TPA: NAD(P)-dependent oxidoreductase [Solirubrobacterales bacterium]|jgi:nucleoside-diphosphate-sugar epimerase